MAKSCCTERPPEAAGAPAGLKERWVMGVVQGAAVMLGSWLRSSRSQTSSTPSALAT